MRLIFYILLAAGAYYCWAYDGIYFFTASAAEKANLPDVPGLMEGPVQQNMSGQSVFLKGYTLTKAARYKVAARVLGKRNYYTDRESQLAPVDLALGWNLMADRRVLSQISITQGGRVYYWYTSDYPIARDQIEKRSANTHIIPANDEVKKQVKWLHRGQVVGLSGYLVNVSASDGWHWESSYTRDDTGLGACEVFYVENVVVY